MFDISISIFLIAITIGLIGGLIFGIFGGGSGLALMPGFYFLMAYFPQATEVKMQVAIATTAAVSFILGLSSTRLQWRRGHIDFAIVKQVFWGLLTGGTLAVILLNVIPSHFLKHLFAVVVILIAVWLWFYQQANDKRVWRFGPVGNFFANLLVGLLWYLLGIAVFVVPFLHKCGVDMRRAVGSATFLSTFLSGIIAIFLMFSGAFHIGVSKNHLGFVNLALLLLTAIPCIIGGYLGTHLSVRLPQKILKKIYAGLMFAVAVLMLI